MKKSNFTSDSHSFQDSNNLWGGRSHHYFLKLAKTRKTTYEFTNKSIKENNLKRILEAGRWAPSCSNSQPWHFIIVKNKRRIKQLMMTANYGDFHTDPPLIVALILVNNKCLGKGLSCYRGNDSGVNDAFMSVAMAGLNMILEARDNNIDSCIITPTQEKVRELLKVKKIDYVPLLIGFGYQKEKAFQKKRVRDSMDSILLMSTLGEGNESRTDKERSNS